jgi:hypothetical protein
METPLRRLVVTEVDSHYNRITITREEIRLKISNMSSRELANRLLYVAYRLLPDNTLQTFRGQLHYDNGDAETMQMRTCSGAKAFTLDLIP